MKRPYIIAEIGVNFYDTAKVMNISAIDAAKLYIDKAFEAGIDCVKFQSYKAETIVSKKAPAYWDTTYESADTQFELFKETDRFGEKDYKELCDYAHAKGMAFISTPFDYASADYLEKMVDFYKISSSDISNIPFVKYVGSKGKPVCLSTGASYLSEVDEAVRALKDSGCPDITLFHCVLSYPTSFEDANLQFIKRLKEVFPDVHIGYSDHTYADKTMTVLTAAYLLGAEVIEKHFTLDKTLKGNDHEHAGEPEDFRLAIDNFKLLEKVISDTDKTVLPCEKESRMYARRSLVLTRAIKKGEKISYDDIMAKRPGTGISPEFKDVVIGRTVNADYEEDTVITWDMV